MTCPDCKGQRNVAELNSYRPGDPQRVIDWLRDQKLSAVVAIAKNEPGGAWEVAWSQMSSGDLVFAERVLNRHVENRLWGDDTP